MAADEFTPDELAELERFARAQEAINEQEAERLGVVLRPVFRKPNGEAPIDESRTDADADEDSVSPLPARAPLDWVALNGKEPPTRQWIEAEWLPDEPCLFAGAGGTGKTLITQQWASMLALGRGLVNAVAAPVRVLMWASEDSHDELWRRQMTIAHWLGVPLAAFAENLILHSYRGEDVTLAGTIHDRLCAAAMMRELREQVGDYKAQYVFLDNTARVFGGNENDRHQVTTFCSLLLGAVTKGGALGFMLLGHPAKAQGSEFSGSTAWEGAVRSRLFLGRTLPDQEQPPGVEEGAPDDDGVRYLCRRKANYSDRDWLKLEYRDGVLAPQPKPEHATRRGPYGEAAKDVVLRSLRVVGRMGETATASQASPAYLLKLAKKFDLLEGVAPKEFERALNVLRKDGRLVQKQVGQYPNRTAKMGLVEV